MHHPTAPLSPSKLVDISWHTFVLHTKDYAEFCNRIAGRFIHHVPDDEISGSHDPGDQDNAHGAQTALSAAESATPWETTAAIVAAGYVVDAPMWEGKGSCSQCHNGCHNDPPPDKKLI